MRQAPRRQPLWPCSAPEGRVGTTPWGLGPGDGATRDRAAAGAADPGLPRLEEAPEPPRSSLARAAGPGNGGDTHMAALAERTSLRALVAARSGRAAAAAVAAAGARPSLCSAACRRDAPLLPWPAGPHPLRAGGSSTPGGARDSLRPLR